MTLRLFLFSLSLGFTAQSLAQNLPPKTEPQTPKINKESTEDLSDNSTLSTPAETSITLPPTIESETKAPPTPEPKSSAEFQSDTPSPDTSKIFMNPSPQNAILQKSAFHIEGTLFLYQDQRGDTSPTTTPYRLSPSITLPVDRIVDLHVRLSIYNGGAEQHTVGENQTGASIVDRAYLRFQWSSHWNLKVGHQFVPVGFYNIDQNPALYYTASIPAVETALLMGPWHENGLMLYGQHKRIEYKVGVFNSLDAGASDASNYKAPSFLNEGKQDGQNAKSKDLMVVGRVDLLLDSGEVGASYAYGHTAQDGGLDTVDFALYEAHFRWSQKGFTLKGLYAAGLLGEGESLPGDTVGTKASGYYVTLAYDILPTSSHYSLPIFYQSSAYNLNEEVPTSRDKDPTLDKSYSSFGLNFSPKNKRYILKLNYNINKNDSSDTSDKEADELELSVGFSI